MHCKQVIDNDKYDTVTRASTGLGPAETKFDSMSLRRTKNEEDIMTQLAMLAQLSDNLGSLETYQPKFDFAVYPSMISAKFNRKHLSESAESS